MVTPQRYFCGITSSRAMKGILGYLSERENGSRRSPHYRKCKDSLKFWLEKLCCSPVQNQPCEIHGEPKATFILELSPDLTRVASAHGDHSVRVTDIRTGKCTHTLTGHHRTPWTLAFHPSYNDILASGCLGGRIYIWDLRGGGRELYNSPNNSVIASLTFHPVDRLMVFCMKNELYLWDWTNSDPVMISKSNTDVERIKYVKFDHLGHYLYTGTLNPTLVNRANETLHADREPQSSSDPEFRERQTANRQRYETLVQTYLRDRRQRYEDLHGGLLRNNPRVHRDLIGLHPEYRRRMHVRMLERFVQRGRSQAEDVQDARDRDQRGEIAASEGPPRTVGEEEVDRDREGRQRGGVAEQGLTEGHLSDRPQSPVDQDRLRTAQDYARYVTSRSQQAHGHSDSGDGPSQLHRSSHTSSIISDGAGPSTSSSPGPGPVLSVSGPRPVVSITGSAVKRSFASAFGASPHSEPPPPPSQNARLDLYALRQEAPPPSQNTRLDLYALRQEASSLPQAASSTGEPGPSAGIPQPGPSGGMLGLEDADGVDVGLGASRYRPGSLQCQYLFQHMRNARGQPHLVEVRQSLTRDIERVQRLARATQAFRCNYNFSGDLTRHCPICNTLRYDATATRRQDLATRLAAEQLSRSSGGHRLETELRLRESGLSRVVEYARFLTQSASAEGSDMSQSSSHQGEEGTGQSNTQAADILKLIRAIEAELVRVVSDLANTQSSYHQDTRRLQEERDQLLESLQQQREKLAAAQSAGSTSPSAGQGESSSSTSSQGGVESQAVSDSENSSQLVASVAKSSKDLVTFGAREHGEPSAFRAARQSRPLSQLLSESGRALQNLSSSSSSKPFPSATVTSQSLSDRALQILSSSLSSSPQQPKPLSSATVTSQTSRPTSQNISSSSTSADSTCVNSDRNADTLLTVHRPAGNSGDDRDVEDRRNVGSSSRRDDSRIVDDINSSSSSADNSSARNLCADPSHAVSTSVRSENRSDRASSTSTDSQTSGVNAAVSGPFETLSGGCESGEELVEVLNESGASEKISFTELARRMANREDVTVLGRHRVGPSPPEESTASTSSLMSLSSSSQSQSVWLPSQSTAAASSAVSSTSVSSSSSLAQSTSTALSTSVSSSQSQSSSPPAQFTASTTSAISSTSASSSSHTPTASANAVSVSGDSASGARPSQNVAGSSGSGTALSADNETGPFVSDSGPSASSSGPSGSGTGSSESSSRISGTGSSESVSGLSGTGSSESGISGTGSSESGSGISGTGSSESGSGLSGSGTGPWGSAEGASSSTGRGSVYAMTRQLLHPDYRRSIFDEITRPSERMQAVINRTLAGYFMSSGDQAMASNFVPGSFRIQRWDVINSAPDLMDMESNVIVDHCKIHNDTSIDISRDSTLLATLVNAHDGGFPDDHILAVFSLVPATLGQCLFTKSFGPNAVSISISPSNRFVLIGLASRRMQWARVTEQLIGQIYYLNDPKQGEKSMKHISDLYHTLRPQLHHPDRFMAPLSINSARWLHPEGEGIVYGTNQGDLCFLRACFAKTSGKDEESPVVRNTISTQTGGGGPHVHRSAFTQTTTEQGAQEG